MAGAPESLIPVSQYPNDHGFTAVTMLASSTRAGFYVDRELVIDAVTLCPTGGAETADITITKATSGTQPGNGTAMTSTYTSSMTADTPVAMTMVTTSGANVVPAGSMVWVVASTGLTHTTTVTFRYRSRRK